MQEGKLLKNIDDVGGNKKPFFSFSEQLLNNLCIHHISSLFLISDYEKQQI